MLEKKRIEPEELLSPLVQEIDEERRSYCSGDDSNRQFCWEEERASQEIRIEEKNSSC